MAGIIQFETDTGTSIIIRRVEVYPKEKAIIKCLYVDNGVENHIFMLEGVDYENWGNDDEYLGHFLCSKLTNGKAKLIGNDYIAPFKPAPVNFEDTRSVHNEADVAKIETLQSQLDEQQKKLQQITTLLVGRGII